MPFTPQVNIQQYIQSPPPTVTGGVDPNLQRELRRISLTLDSLVRAVEEIREYMTTLP